MIKHLPIFLFQSFLDFLTLPEFFTQNSHYLDDLKSVNPSRTSKKNEIAIGCIPLQKPFPYHPLQLSLIRSFKPAIFELNFNI